MPANAREHSQGSKAAIYLEQPGANTRVRSWCPTPGAQYGFLVTHNEAISIADFFTVRGDDGAVLYRPTCNYAYHPCNDAVLSLHEMFGAAGKAQPVQHVLDEDELVDGADELGVLLYGHEGTPTGTAPSFRWKRRAGWRPTRTPPASRSPPPCSPAWSGRWRTPNRHRRGRRDGL